eukprot:g399.t1
MCGQCVSRKPGIFGIMETLGNLAKWVVGICLLIFGCLCIYSGRYFSSVPCDFPAARYLFLFGLGTVGMLLVELYAACVVNAHGAHETLEAKKPKGSKVVSIGRFVFVGGLLLILMIVNISIYMSRTCQRTSSESSSAKLSIRLFTTLYDAIRTLVSSMDFLFLTTMLYFIWRKCDDVDEEEEEGDADEEKALLPETSRAVMEAHHAES